MILDSLPLWFVALVATCAIGALLALVWIASRLSGLARSAGEASEMRLRLEALAQANERLERELRAELAQGRQETIAHSAAARQENAASLGQLAQALQTQAMNVATLQGQQLDALAQQLATLTGTNEQRLEAIRSTVDQKLESTRGTVEQKLETLRQDNASRLEAMRTTVDEKLQSTLERRLGQSFQLVSERLEQVQRGLGEMQSLAAGVGDLKRVLTNVKTRGAWGEMQLEALLEQILVRAQYEKNVAPRPGSQERVEFAIRLPGRGTPRSGVPGVALAEADADSHVWLPIDAKFPIEDYTRLLEAQDRADLVAVDAAAKALEVRLRAEAQKIRDKYIAPPFTTDFAILYLPVEGLYAEALRRTGLAEQLQRDCRVVVAGPTTLAAMLNSLQMGFRTLAIEQRSAEVWQLLAAVKAEFGKFAEVLAKTREKLAQASDQIGKAETRTRAIERKLRDVESLPDEGAAALLAGELAIAAVTMLGEESGGQSIESPAPCALPSESPKSLTSVLPSTRRDMPTPALPSTSTEMTAAVLPALDVDVD